MAGWMFPKGRHPTRPVPLVFQDGIDGPVSIAGHLYIECIFKRRKSYE